MAVNLCTRNYRLIIGGLDCSLGVVGIAYNQSQYASNSGLIVTQGQITLRQTLGFKPDLDDRTNPQWSRKTPVTFEVADTSGTLRPAPVGAKTYIIEAEYDGRQTLSITTACAIGLLDAAASPGPGVDVRPGQSVSGMQIAQQIAARLGGISIIGSIPSEWKTPTSKVDNRSYLKYLGALCWANGRIAYSNDDNITIKPVNIYPPPLLTRWVEREAQDYGRLTGAERPCEVVKVSGVALDVDNTPDDDVTETTEYATVASIVPRTAGTGGGNEITVSAFIKTTSSRNKSIRTETDLIEAQRARALIDPRVNVQTQGVAFLTKLVEAETTTTIRRYEQKPSTLGFVVPGVGDPDDDDAEQPVDEGRLLTEIEETTIAGVYALKAYNENLPQDLRVLVTDDAVSTRTVTTHKYNFIKDPPPGAEFYAWRSGTVQYSRTRETTKLKGVAFPNIHFSWCAKSVRWEITEGNRTQVGYQFVPSQSPLEEIVTDRVIVEYIERRPDEWEEITTTYQATVDSVDVTVYSNVNGEVCYVGSPPNPLPAGVVATNLTSGTAKLVQKSRVIRRGPQVQPPSPSRFSKEIATKERIVTGEADLPPIVGGSLQDREREYFAEAGTLSTNSQADQVAKIEGVILIGRHKGAKFALDCADPFFHYTPLSAMDWVEPNGKIQRYLIDGLSLGMSDRQLVAAADGIWVGTVGTVDPINPPPPNPPPPDPESTVETPPPSLPFRPVYRFRVTMAGRGIMASLPFPTNRVFTFATFSGHYFGGLSRAGDAGLATVGTIAAIDPIIRGAGDAPIISIGSDLVNAPPLPNGDAPIATISSEPAHSPPLPNGDAPVAAVGSESAPAPAIDGDPPTITIGSEGA